MIRPKTLSALLLAVVLFEGPGQAGPPPEIALPGHMRTTYFTVRYDPSDPYLAELMARVARKNLVRISDQLGYEPSRNKPFSLYVYPSHLGFIEAGGLETARFTVGTAGPHDKISVDASGAFVPPEEVMAHEITHAIIFRMLAFRASELPLWMNEGLAVYESKDYYDEEDKQVADAAAQGTLIGLESLSEQFSEDDNSLSYAESTSAVRYLISEHGKTAPRRLLGVLAQGKSLDEAFAEVHAGSASRFASDWYDWTTRKYWQIRLARTLTAIFSLLMAVLAIAAFLVRRKQKIEAVKRWEQEEFEEALRRQLGNDWWR